LEDLKGGDQFEDIDGRIILNWILGKYNASLWTEFKWLRIQSNNGLSKTW
jgi:hypothetical protein